MSHCEERSDEAIPSKNEIARPFGLAMTLIISSVWLWGSMQHGQWVSGKPIPIAFLGHKGGQA
jgi:hypothetical protein